MRRKGGKRGGGSGDDGVEAFPFADPAELLVAKSLLEAKGIPFFVPNEGAQHLIGAGEIGMGYNVALGPPTILVEASHAENARRALTPLRKSRRSAPSNVLEDADADAASEGQKPGRPPRRLRAVFTAVALVMIAVLFARSRWAHTDSANCRRYVEKDPDLAVHYCTSAIDHGRLSKRGRAYALIDRGEAYLHKKDYDQAIRDYDESIWLLPDYGDTFGRRGVAYMYQGGFERAISDFDQAIRLQLQQPMAWLFEWRGVAYRSNGFHEKAIVDFDHALELEPTRGRVFYDRGVARFCLRQFPAAEADFDRARQLGPPDAFGAMWLYVLKQRRGDSQAKGALAGDATGPKDKWPAPLVQFLLGNVSKDQLLNAAKDQDRETDANQRRQAWFFMAEAALLHGDQSEAAFLFKAVGDAGRTFASSYAAALSELQFLNAEATHQ